MASKDPRVDAFINQSADFAKPILRHVRKLVHSVCPRVEETMKWRFPSYEYKGIICITPAFKRHCALIFWQKSIRAALRAGDKTSAGGDLRRLTRISDLPRDAVLRQSIRESVKLNEAGVKQQVPRRPRKAKPVLPDFLRKALDAESKARAGFDALSPSHQREYIDWITQARRDETKTKRIASMLKWLREGKSRNWKYAGAKA